MLQGPLVRHARPRDELGSSPTDGNDPLGSRIVAASTPLEDQQRRIDLRCGSLPHRPDDGVVVAPPLPFAAVVGHPVPAAVPETQAMSVSFSRHCWDANLPALMLGHLLKLISMVSTTIREVQDPKGL